MTSVKREHLKRLRKATTRFVGSVLLFSNFSLTAYANTYIVGLQNFDYYPHYNFTSDQDKGFIWTVLESYAKESGHTFVYQPMPVPRMQLELQKGTIDLIYPDNPIFHPGLIEPDDKIYSIDIIRTLSGAIVKRENLSMQVNDVKRVSLPYGFTPLNWQGREKNGDIVFVETSDSLTALQMVELGRTDAAEVDYFVTSHLSATNPTIGHFALSPALPHNIIGFKLATINQPDLIAEINQFIRHHQSELTATKQRYGIQDPEELLSTLGINSQTSAK